MEFNFKKIEEKWKSVWVENGTYKVTEDPNKSKYYVLDMFPYPSGAGLHVGHPLGYVASDIYARYKRLKGFNVLHPMGYDAFGLPAEQYAIETGTHPAVTTEKAIKRYREQLDKIGFSYDWSRQVVTCEPDYYKWTQWIFLKLFGSWYNREANKAELIETLIERFEREGCISPSPLRREGVGQFTAEEWKGFSKVKQQQVLMNYRLAFLSYAEVNWCEALGTVLANDEVKDGKSERGGHPVERRKMRQWFLRITEYSDRLLDGLNTLDWSDAMKEMQRNWIGRSEGALIKFQIAHPKPFPKGRASGSPPLGELEGAIEVFTTRPDTIFGATFMVIAPEHDLVESLTTPEQKEAVDKYVAYVKSRTDVERQQEKRVTGEFTGSYAVNPFNGNPIPIYMAEYVLAGYGTGAIMAVPADDERDRKFAEKFGLPIIEIIDKSMYPGATIEDKVGKMINSEFLNGLEVKDAIKAVLDEIEKRGIGQRKVNYKQRDAGYSRQRYWGEPFPIKYGPNHTEGFDDSGEAPIPLSEDKLPLVLPEVSSFKPGGDGRSPLANSEAWVKAGYETDTMPGYAGSSWYFLRYMDATNPNEFAAKDKIDYWKNVDIYFGGAEHAVGHLLYSRMWHKFLHDLGYVPTDEPFQKMVNQGMIQGVSKFVHRSSNLPNVFISANKAKSLTAAEIERYGTLSEIHADVSIVNDDELDVEAFKKWKPDYATAEFVLEDNGQFICTAAVEKMSKSKYNVVNPDDVIDKYGADCFRMFEMFLGPIEQSKPWDDKGISGTYNFLRKFWRLFGPTQTLPEGEGYKLAVTDDEPTKEEYKTLHKTIKKIADDIERLNYNTCVSSFMIAVNELTAANCNKRKVLEPLLILLAPFAPFITEELWSALGNTGSVHQAIYPKFEEQYLVESEFEYPISINGKTRAQVKLALDLSEAEARAAVLALESVQKWTNGAEPKKFIYVKGRIINVVV